MIKRNADHYFEKAAKYDLLANYYKYTNPNLHVQYYSKHLSNLQKAVQNLGNGNEMRPAAARVRVIHASPDSPSVDVYINGMRTLRDVSYKHVSDYLSLPTGRYQIDMYPAGTMVSTVISRKVNIESGRYYTLAAIGPGANLRLMPIEDHLFVPSSETKLRIAHFSPDAPSVDIAVKNGDVIFPNATFRKMTDYVGLTPMTVDLEVRLTGTSTVVLPLPNIRMNPNTAYTILILGLAEGNPELEALIINP
ncbi:hypothetical protein JOC77_001968 [Peribacillus deserti]|uniref:DUF4397 domain-containing protein n=1 Tax=Peribacillus deserti TaxID=673318 RepID=A0ABS2QHA8_9BACI|nr:DUF4397 domain-containing protein [Peribacillus deserti]MBM7692538.1 hypothetical protein [Peribacillus deserti]